MLINITTAVGAHVVAAITTTIWKLIIFFVDSTLNTLA